MARTAGRLRALAFGLLLAAGPAGAEELDLIIRGGTVIDGTGAPGYPADVGVQAGRIVRVGDLADVAATHVLDARGRVVAPGFIDAHSHVPHRLVRSQGPLDFTQLLTQGITTVVDGPDGNFAPAEIHRLIATLSERGSSINYAFYVGHNGIRRQVMGNRPDAPTAAELDTMRRLVREGMEMGCLGLSTGLMYQPGMFSKTEEVVALAREVAPFGGIYDSHTRNPVFELLASDQEAIDIGRQAGIPVKLAHVKPVGLINQGLAAAEVELVEAARRAGRTVVADQYPYDGAATAALEEIVIVPGELLATAAKPDPGELRRLLADPAARAEIRRTSEQGLRGGFAWIKAVGYGSMRIVHAPSSPSLVGRNIQLLAEERRADPFDLVAELIVANPEPVIVTLGSVAEEDVRTLMVQPWTMIASDGAYVDPARPQGHHPRSTGTFTRVLGHYVRDVGLLSLPEAIRKMTSFPAAHLNLHDRGRIAVGLVADLTVFDPATIRDRSSYVDPAALSEGVVHVVVNGMPVLQDGAATGALPGRFVKRQAPPPR